MPGMDKQSVRDDEVNLVTSLAPFCLTFVGVDVSWGRNTVRRKIFSLALKDDRVEQCLVGANSKCKERMADMLTAKLCHF